MNITEFLLERIDEDERHAQKLAETDHRPVLSLATTINHPQRLLAECEAKRAILQQAISLGSDGHYAAEYMPPSEHEEGASEVGGRRIYPGHPNYTQTVIFSGILRTLAAIYADHEDYQQEWATS